MATESSVTAPVTPDEAAPPPGPSPLRRNRNFRTLWLGSTFSILGIEVADIGYPLVVLVLTGSPGRAGLFAMVQTLCMLLTGLPAGAVVDRYNRRLILIVGEGVRALATAGVAFALWQHDLTLGQLLVTAAVLGLIQPLSGTARMVLIRSVVPSEQLTAALTTDEIRLAGAGLVGPPLGGFLFGLARLAPFLFTAGAFVLSFLCALVLRVPPKPAPVAAPEAPDDATAAEATGDAAVPEQPAGQPAKPPAKQSPLAEMFAGIGALWADPVLRTTTLLVASINMIGAPLALIAVVLLREQHVASWEIGVAMGGLAVGGLAGTPLIGPLHKRFRPGRLLLGMAVLIVAVLVALAFPFGPWWLMGVLIVGALGMPALRVLVDVLIFRQVPDEQRGRVIGSVMTLFGLGAPLGAGVAGLLLQQLSATSSMLILAAVLAVLVGYALAQRGLRRAEWPEDSGH